MKKETTLLRGPIRLWYIAWEVRTNHSSLFSMSVNNIRANLKMTTYLDDDYSSKEPFDEIKKTPTCHSTITRPRWSHSWDSSSASGRLPVVIMFDTTRRVTRSNSHSRLVGHQMEICRRGEFSLEKRSSDVIDCCWLMCGAWFVNKEGKFVKVWECARHISSRNRPSLLPLLINHSCFQSRTICSL